MSNGMWVERRAFARRLVKWNVEVRGLDGERSRATSVDVGPEGMQLSLDRGALLRLCPRGHLTSRADELKLNLTLQPGNDDDAEPIEVSSRVCHVRRLSQFEYRLGVEFLAFTADAEAKQMGRLRALLQPPDKLGDGSLRSEDGRSNQGAVRTRPSAP